MGDASVTDQNDSDVVYVEVHSDTFVHTARKIIILLFHYLRLLKYKEELQVLKKFLNNLPKSCIRSPITWSILLLPLWMIDPAKRL